MIRIERWSVGVGGDGYQAPEVCGIVLHGVVTGHPRKADGSEVTTSRVRKVEGRVVLTNSGNTYLLGEPHPEYAEKYPAALDPENPIKVCR